MSGSSQGEHARTEAFFRFITRRPLPWVLVFTILLVGTSAGLTRLVKDTSVKAFIPPDHPSLLTDAAITETFGLTDTIAVAVIGRDPNAVFEPHVLAALRDFSDRIAALENIRDDRVSSIATKASIDGDGGAVMVDDYVPLGNVTDADAHSALARWRNMPQHQQTLVNPDANAAIIMAEMRDLYRAESTYRQIQALVDDLDLTGFDVHIAGPAAVSGLMSAYIDRDASRLQPLVFVLVVAFIYFAFRRLRALPGPVFVVLGATGGAMGLMAWANVPYFAITNALPVIIIAISVADAVHILSAYYRLRARDPEAPVRELVVGSMTEMLRPVTLTTLTTMAGFFGIAMASIMPPITAFAWCAALGVLLAWLFSILALPNLLILMPPGESPSFRNWQGNRPSGLGRFLAHCGAVAAARYKLALTLFVGLTLVALHGASMVRFDRSQVDNFKPDSAIRVADETINGTFAGTAFLNVMIETDEADGLISVDRMRKIIDLQDFVERQPHVQKTVAITDYISQLHKAIEALPLNGSERLLPDSDDAIAQYLLVYEVSGDPTGLEEEIDTLYQNALVRVAMNEHHFSENRGTVEAIQQYIERQFDEPGMTASLGGDVNLTYHWMDRLEQGHVNGVLISLSLVLLAATVMFRSLASGLVSVIPVCFTLLVIYACMGYTGVYLEPATSMFAAIALGVGVDFAIHLVDKLREALRMHDGNVEAAVEHALPPIARACFFNSAALGLGFAVLNFSELPTLQRFGSLIAVAAFSSFAAALLLVPALFAAGRAVREGFGQRATILATRTSGVLLLALAGLLAPQIGEAADDKATTLARNVADREEGIATRRIIDISLTDRRGRTREREALVLKLNSDDARLTRISYLAPRSVRDVSFLSHDHHSAERDDDRWLYVPATHRARRLPASARGDYFLGTDFTYEDIQSELKFDLSDYDFEYRGEEAANGRALQVIAGIPKSDAIARELGYGAFEAWVDETIWMPVRVEFKDVSLEPLKTITVNRTEVIDGIVTATEIEAANHQTGHRTVFALRDVVYLDELPGSVFEANGLTRGLPSSLLE